MQESPAQSVVATVAWGNDMLGRIVGAVRFKEPLSFHTSLRIGGPAEFFIVPWDLDDVRYALAFAEQDDLPVVVIGGGNNMLVGDQGIQGVVLKLQGVFGRVEFDGTDAVVGAGVSLGAFIREAAARNLGGLEHLAGIPATIGGALAMNVATPEGSLVALCAGIYFLHPDGTVGEVHPAPGVPVERFTLPPGGVVLGCRIPLVRRPQAEIQREIQQRLKRKKTTQPFALASVGYVWKNPPGDSAAGLIERAGLRGKRIRNLELSSKCGNFIVNRGNATAADVLAFMKMTRDRVEARTGVTLEPQIQLVGLDTAALEPERLELATA